MSKPENSGLEQEAPGQDQQQPPGPTGSQPEEAERPPAAAGFPVVGIGASAGGLEAFETFFTAMPADKDPDMAFVLVQHLAPEYKSILDDLIKRFTRLQVLKVEDGMVVQPNCIYVIPPDRDMAFLNGTLQLLKPVLPRGQHLPIDFFFRSLAEDLHERAICIVLSGTGSDGTLGARAVKGEGGMVMAQQPETAEFDGMPASVIATGVVDYVLPAADMPAKLMAYAAQAYRPKTTPLSARMPSSEEFLQKIFVLLRSQTGHDFSQYKYNTINRRIERRMAVHQIAELADYVRFLQQTPSELQTLFQELLIGVTNFFRDAEAFSILETKAIARLFADKPSGSTFRVWVCGCSTGEEAYSLAIILQEQMEALKQYFMMQLFATDIDSRAIEQARVGIYPASIAVDVSAQRLARFFILQPDGLSYRISKSIREMVIFSEHDIIKDPPFSKMDLITCRNLLIYLSAELQKKLLPLFHYALNAGGMLFLGTSETVGECEEIFTPIDRQWKLYQRKENDMPNTYRPILRRLFQPLPEGGGAIRPSAQSLEQGKFPLRELTERLLLQRYAPAAALISERGDILYLHGRTGRFLELSPGEATLNIVKMAREGLHHYLATALYKAVTQQQQVNHSGLRVKTNGNFTAVNLTVLPVASASQQETIGGQPLMNQTLYLVVLEEVAESGPEPTQSSVLAPAAGPGQGVADLDQHLKALKQELQLKEEYLQRNIEELDSSNEEMQSVNEELQSTNEELETSQEELQSVNEELATVNSELQAKIIDLSRANNDMKNLLAGTEIGMIFVDHNLHIQRFTPAVTRIINLIASDVGRPLRHIASNLAGYDRLVADVQAVLDTLAPKEIEVRTSNGDWFLLCIRPYRTLENVIEGAVITFVNIMELKKAREINQRLAAIIKDAHDAILMHDLEGRILAWNPAAQSMYGWSETEALTMKISDLVPEELRDQEQVRRQQQLAAKSQEPYRTVRLAKDGSLIKIWLTATALLDEAGQIYAVALTERLDEAADVR